MSRYIYRLLFHYFTSFRSWCYGKGSRDDRNLRDLNLG